MTISQVDGKGFFTGSYLTLVSVTNQTTITSPLTGVQQLKDQPTLAFSVGWLFSASVTSWVGQCYRDPQGNEFLITTWLLRGDVPQTEDWKATRVGQNVFVRIMWSCDPTLVNNFKLFREVICRTTCSSMSAVSCLLSLSCPSSAMHMIFRCMHRMITLPWQAPPQIYAKPRIGHTRGVALTLSCVLHFYSRDFLRFITFSDVKLGQRRNLFLAELSSDPFQRGRI